MIHKIISGAQAGVEQAALDIAIKLGIPHGGWIPKWRKMEDSTLVSKYGQLQEMENANYSRTTEENVKNSDGTLIISQGQLSGCSALNRRLAERHQRPYLYIDLNTVIAFHASKMISDWIRDHGIEILNVTGLKNADGFNVYQMALNILETAFEIGLADITRYVAMPAAMADPTPEMFIDLPQSVEQAVTTLMERLTFKEKTKIANISEKNLFASTSSLRVYIKNEFRLWEKNEKRIESSYHTVSEQEESDDITDCIIMALWEKLQTSNNVLRIVR
jgi:hypothetical protein